MLAERVWTDQNNKKIIGGTFNQVLIGRMPRPEQASQPPGAKGVPLAAGHDPGCPMAYISLTDVVDATTLSLQFFNLSRNRMIAERTFEIKGRGRLATIELVVPLPPLAQIVKEAGSYTLDVVWQGEILGSHRLTVKEIEHAEGGKP
ncbi:MAG TPA: hypothetical protein PKD86_03610 [Gemmatales bacterium]|nr:hypothetical protein [Gemmatales bacterium]HMP58420.1 hypothetical protein [Gemmatales bacterium]